MIGLLHEELLPEAAVCVKNDPFGKFMWNDGLLSFIRVRFKPSVKFKIFKQEYAPEYKWQIAIQYIHALKQF